MDEALYACRFLQFTAAMLIFGTAAFRVYALPGSNASSAGSLARFDAWCRLVMLAAALVALISGMALVLCYTAAMAGSPAAAIEPAVTATVLFETHFGRVWIWHLLFAVVLVLACLGRPPRRLSVLMVSLGCLASLGWVGHATIGSGAARIIHQINQSGHLLAAGLWLGGLPPLGWVLRQARQSGANFEISLVRCALRNFSHMGSAAVALLALTGAANTLLLVGSLGAMFSTSYGRLLSFKLLLFSLMVAVALSNRFRLAPRIARDPIALRTLVRSVALEQGLALAVLAIVSVLGTWPPALCRRST